MYSIGIIQVYSFAFTPRPFIFMLTYLAMIKKAAKFNVMNENHTDNKFPQNNWLRSTQK